MQTWRMAPVLGAVLVASLGTGCATKKYVRQQVDPVNTRVGEVQKDSNGKISSLDEKTSQGISRVDEKAMAAANSANQAGQAAQKASEQATEADRHAADARSLAEKGIDQTEQLSARVDNLDNYQQVSTESVLFGFGKSALTPEGKEKLDQVAQALGSHKHFVIQVEGYTDSTGSSEYNLELSRRRANAVVNYLTLDHKIPLYRIHVAGFGKATPVAENKNRDGRKQNRRVDVRVFSPNMAAGGSAASTSSSARTNAPTQ